MKITEEKLLRITMEEERNNEELNKIMKQAKDAKLKAEKHMSFRKLSFVFCFLLCVVCCGVTDFLF